MEIKKKRFSWRGPFDERMNKFNITNLTVEDLAEKIVRKAVEKKMIAGRSYKSLIDHCLYCAIRILEYPMTYSEMSKIRRKPIKMELVQEIKETILDEMDLKMKNFPLVKYVQSLSNKYDFIPSKIIEIYYNMVKTWEKKSYNYRSPDSILATILYHAGHDTRFNITQNQCAEIFNTTDYTIRALLEYVEEKLGWNWEEK